MEGCISNPFFSILLNGTSKCFFKSSRGLRQSDPLSPFLFLIAIDVLSAVLKKVEHESLIKGFIMGED